MANSSRPLGEIHSSLQGYLPLPTPSLSGRFLVSRSIKHDEISRNKRLVENFENLLLRRIPLAARGSIVSTLLPSDLAAEFRQGTPISQSQFEELLRQVLLIQDIYHWATTLTKVTAATLLPVTPAEFAQLESELDFQDHDLEIQKLQALQKSSKPQVETLKAQGIDVSGIESAHEESLAAAADKKCSQLENNNIKLLTFLHNKGYTSDLLSPSFIQAISPENLKNKTFSEIQELIHQEIVRFYTLHSVSKNQKVFRYVVVEKFSSLSDLKDDIIAAGIPLFLLSPESYSSLENPPLSPSLQSELDTLVNISRDINFLLNCPPLPFCNFSFGVSAPTSRALRGYFNSRVVSDTLQPSHPFSQLPFYNTKDKTLQFFFPSPSTLFNLKNSAYEQTFLELQRYFNLYSFFYLFHGQSRFAHPTQGGAAQATPSFRPLPLPIRRDLPTSSSPVLIKPIPIRTAPPPLPTSRPPSKTTTTTASPPSAPPPPMPASQAKTPSSSREARGALLSQITSPRKLRSVPPPEEDAQKRLAQKQEKAAKAGDTAATLKSALSRRADAMQTKL